MAGLHKRRQQKQAGCVAWLALVALWLTIGMPVVSRSLPDGMASVDLGAWCTGHGLVDHASQRPAAPAAPTDKCGYCSLFCHSPLIAGEVGLLVAPRFLGAQPPLAIAVPEPPVLHLGAARSRGPPSQA
ncbi:MAG: hypothetical protein WDW38_006388 [Sanguina aurantia]